MKKIVCLLKNWIESYEKKNDPHYDIRNKDYRLYQGLFVGFDLEIKQVKSMDSAIAATSIECAKTLCEQNLLKYFPSDKYVNQGYSVSPVTVKGFNISVKLSDPEVVLSEMDSLVCPFPVEEIKEI